jgi:EAL domain-containing protein (putative c-di-GMP-specific phosphodiesterase class I)
MGVKLLIDDFGTGYSSMSYLQRFPFDIIKIDQSFVIPMLDSPDSAAIVHSTIELGHILGRQVVAEGVESLAIWERLREQGCDFAQGYGIGKPIPIEEFQRWKTAWKARAAWRDLA